MGLRISGSKLHLAASCQYPFRGDVGVEQKAASVAARRGSAFHELAAAYIEAGARTPPAPADVSRVSAKHGTDAGDVAFMFRGWCVQWQSVAPPRAEAELAVAYDPHRDRARIVGKDIQRRYAEHGVRPEEIPLSLDVTGRDDRCLYVIDHKTGRWGPRAESLQIRAGAYALSRITGVEHASVAIHSVAPDGSITVHAAELTAAELTAIGAQLRGIAAKCANRPEPSPGDHCFSLGCPVSANCPGLKRDAE